MLRIVLKQLAEYLSYSKRPPFQMKRKPMLPTVSNLLPLHFQCPSSASAATKIRLSLLATAMVDALGGPAEFHERFTFDPVLTMIPNQNFGLKPGVWTDDTSMALCLAHSLASSKAADGFNERSQLEAYLNWFQKGELSAIGTCFDIGITIRRALELFQYQRNRTIQEVLDVIAANLSAESFSGNGSLMRVLPIGLAYWRNEGKARAYAARSSRVTHPSPTCVEACEVWTDAIVKTMRAAVEGRNQWSKLDLLEYFSSYPYNSQALRDQLSMPTSAGSLPIDISKAEKEGYYWLHHPLLLKITAVNKPETHRKLPGLPYPMPSIQEVPSTGYVVHSLVAALYCFLSTETFEDGALMAVNMGHDADTIGAIYAGLAGVWYAGEGESDKFWSRRVFDWNQMLVEKGLVKHIADELVAFSEKLV